MKSNYLSLFFSLETLNSLALFLIEITGARSAEENSFVFGLSGPRLAIAVFLLSSTVIFGVFWLLSFRNPSWALNASRSLDTHFGNTDNLLAASFYSALLILAIPALVALGIQMHYGQIAKRMAELLVWVDSLAILLLGLLVARYRPLYRLPGFFSHAAHKIVRVSFIGHQGFWLALSLIVLSIVVLIPASSISMNRVPGHDSGIFLYFGRQILQGKIPFRDLWDHKPPMIFYLDALGLLLGRGSVWGVWSLECLSLACSSLLGFMILRRYYRNFPAALGVCTALGSLIFMIEGGNLTEEYSLPLQWAVLGLFALSERHGWKDWRGSLCAFTIGVLFCLALNFKQTMVGTWLALFLWLGLSWLLQHRQDLLKVFAWAFLGAILSLAVIMMYFAAHHCLAEYWRIAFVYNLLYSDVTPNLRIEALIDLVNFLTRTTPLFPLVFMAWGAGIWTIVREALRRETILPFPLLIALIDLPIELVLISISGKNYRHYFITLIPAMAILIAWGSSRPLSSARRFSGWQTALGTLLLAGFIFTPSIQNLLVMAQPTGEVTITETVQTIKHETQPGDYVLIWGSQSVVNFLADRPAPTRFVHQKALFRAGFADAALSAEMLDDLQTRTPRLIINTHLPSTPFITTGPDGECHIPPDLPDGMDAVFHFICQNYRLDQVITKDQWEIYKLIK